MEMLLKNFTRLIVVNAECGCFVDDHLLSKNGSGGVRGLAPVGKRMIV
jgi:hypothetical protein